MPTPGALARSLTLLLIAAQLFLAARAATSDAQDAAALLAFRAALAPASRQLLESWANASAMCTAWTGVTCAASGRVARL